MSDARTLELPTAPDEDSLRLLLRARLMLSHALEHASLNTEFDNMIAILGLDNTIEYVLRSISSHLDLESVTGKSFDIFELASLAASINKALNEHANVKLPYMGEIKLLRQTRNLVQHGAVAPQADLARFSKIVERFFNKVLILIFGFGINELRTSAIIENNSIKEHLKKSEEAIDSKEWLESIIHARNAFENEYFNQVKSLNLSISLYPALVHESEKNEISNWSWSTVKDELEISNLGLHSTEYRRFKEYINHIPSEFNAEDSWGNIVMQRPWEDEDAIFCYNFAANTLLRWQAQGKERLYIPNIDTEYEWNESINGISISNDAEIGCHYVYGEGDSIVLVYADKETKRSLEKLSRGENYTYHSIRHDDGKKAFDSEQQINLKGLLTFLMVNEPEKWGVIIWYKNMEQHA